MKGKHPLRAEEQLLLLRIIDDMSSEIMDLVVITSIEKDDSNF